MPRHHMIDGVEIPFTAQEEIDADAHDTQVLADKPMQDWRNLMAQSDSDIPRWAEDLYDAMNINDRANVSQETQDKMSVKKTKRAQKP